MLKYERLGEDTRPPWWRSLLLALFACFPTVISTVFSPSAWAIQNPAAGILAVPAMLAFLAAIGLPVAMFWRHRLPFVLTIASALVSLVLPIGNTIPLILLASLLGRRRGPAVLWTTGLVALTSIWVVIADALAQPRGASVLKGAFGGAGNDPTVYAEASAVTVGVVIVVGLGVSIGAGLLMRARHETAAAQETATAERATTDRLSDEVARRQERERIAREVHDALGHRLSLLNLHAGALEAHSADDPRVAESAALIRSSAAAAMGDLQSLLAVLRDPVGGEPAALPLARLPEIVRDSFGTGQPLNSSIFIQDAERADPTLSRAVYRIVQELLTNARKHAAGHPVTLSVEGGPARGIVIDARNPFTPQMRQREQRGGTRGLTGIAERAELLGGTLTYGLDDDGRTFRVNVELPWREA